MGINQHYPQNLAKIRENKPPEYEANIILLRNKQNTTEFICWGTKRKKPDETKSNVPKSTPWNRFRDMCQLIISN